MRKPVVLFLLCAFIFVLASCSVPYEFMQDVSDLDQIQIEIVNLESDMGDWGGSVYSEENVRVVKVIENDDKDGFLSKFKQIKCYQPNFGGRIDFISGRAVRIVYSNGDVELITHHGTATVNDGEIWVHTTKFDSEAFAALLDEFS